MAGKVNERFTYAQAVVQFSFGNGEPVLYSAESFMEGPYGRFENTASFSGLGREIQSIAIGETRSISLVDRHSYYNSHTFDSTAIGVHGKSGFVLSGTVQRIDSSRYNVNLDIKPHEDRFDYDYNGIESASEVAIEAARFGAWIQAGISTFGFAFAGTPYNIEFVGPGKAIKGVYSFEELTRTGIGATIEAPRCFPAGTLISLPGGQVRPIEAIAVGDIVLAFDAQGALEPARVARLFGNITHEWIELVWRDKANGEWCALTATPGHVMLTAEGGFAELAAILSPFASSAAAMEAAQTLMEDDPADDQAGGGAPAAAGSAQALHNGPRFDRPAGFARIVTETGETVEAVAFRIKYSEANAHLYERAEMLVTRNEGGASQARLVHKVV